jgi:phytoene dehydrogenase-like protein
MKQEKYDAIVIGGGHNGLIHAAYLAKTGRKVLVLERRHIVGGAAVTEEVNPGFKYTVASYVVSLLRPEVIRELDLPRFGLEILPLESTVTPLPNGDYLARWADHAKTRQEIMRHSIADAEAYDQFGKLMYHMAVMVKPILGMVPPKIGLGALSAVSEMGKSFRQFGEKYFYLMHKLMTMSSADFLDEWFETECLKATMSASGIIGTFLGPRSPGTAYVLLHHYMGEIDGNFRAWGFQRGGMGGVSDACAKAAQHYGAEIRCEASVANVITSNGRAKGIALENGDEIYADVISSSLDPKRTFLKIMDPKILPEDFVHKIENYKIRGSSGKVNLSLSELPNFTCMRGEGAHHRGAFSISPNIEYLERAYDDAKYGNFSQKPYMDVIIPSMIDPNMAPPGRHVMSIFVQYAPYHLKGRTWEEAREDFGDAVVNTLAEYAPNLKNAILHRQVLSPWDIEQKFGLTEGNIFQGDLSLDQLFVLRPVAGWAQFRTPLKNFYMCGSGVHPGGGVMGGPGRLSAMEIIKEKGW